LEFPKVYFIVCVKGLVHLKNTEEQNKKLFLKSAFWDKLNIIYESGTVADEYLSGNLSCGFQIIDLFSELMRLEKYQKDDWERRTRYGAKIDASEIAISQLQYYAKIQLVAANADPDLNSKWVGEPRMIYNDVKMETCLQTLEAAFNKKISH